MGLVTPPCKKVQTTETTKRKHRNLIRHGRAEVLLYNETMTATGQSQKDASILTTKVFHAKTTTFVAIWNVGTLCKHGNLDKVMKEIINYKIDILGLCEMRWTGSDKMKEDGKTIIYSGHSDKHILGVGLCLSLPVAKSLISWKPVNERIITARFQTRHAKVIIIQAHAPAMEADDNKKDNFYKILQNIINKVPRHNIKLLMGELNAQIDKSRQGMESIIGPHGSANITNNNGERFTLLCSVNEIRIGNTFFKHKDIHKTTWSLLTITQRMKFIIFPLVVDGVNHYKMLEL